MNRIKGLAILASSQNIDNQKLTGGGGHLTSRFFWYKGVIIRAG